MPHSSSYSFSRVQVHPVDTEWYNSKGTGGRGANRTTRGHGGGPRGRLHRSRVKELREDANEHLLALRELLDEDDVGIFEIDGEEVDFEEVA